MSPFKRTVSRSSRTGRFVVKGLSAKQAGSAGETTPDDKSSAARTGGRSAKTGRFVTLNSRDGKRVEIADLRDREFLKWADDFIIEARNVQKDPSRRTPRL